MASARFGRGFPGTGGTDPTAGVRRPPEREPLRPEAIEATASLLRVIALPARISLLGALTGGEAAVSELGDRFGLPHKNASCHLRTLHRAGVLSRRREGKLALYAMADWSAWWAIEQIARSVEAGSGRGV